MRHSSWIFLMIKIGGITLWKNLFPMKSSRRKRKKSSIHSSAKTGTELIRLHAEAKIQKHITEGNPESMTIITFRIFTYSIILQKLFPDSLLRFQPLPLLHLQESVANPKDFQGRNNEGN